VTVQINHTRSVKSVSHQVYAIEQRQKTELLLHLLGLEQMETTLVFTRTKHKAMSLAVKLIQFGFSATSLQGNLSQNKRQAALNGFKDGTFKILVATDIAARGIDVTGISHVINYDMPDTAEAYIHRTGRTGRAACTGKAVSFATTEDSRMIRTIEQSLDGKMQRQPVSPAVLASPHTESEFCSENRQRKPNGNQTKTASGSRRPSNRPATSGTFGFSGREK
jgi:superfamily II DNA/RNA helicase